MLECRLGISNTEASDIFSFFPIGAMVLTPLLGGYLDTKGKGASMLMLGSILMIACHLVFAVTPDSMFTKPVAYSAIVLLGVSFSLVPAALWPSVPKLVENRYLGSAYSVVFWIQNIGLFFPMLISWSLWTNVNVSNLLNITTGFRCSYLHHLVYWHSCSQSGWNQRTGKRIRTGITNIQK